MAQLTVSLEVKIKTPEFIVTDDGDEMMEVDTVSEDVARALKQHFGDRFVEVEFMDNWED